MIFCHPCFDVIGACTEFFGEVVYFTERGGFLELRVICEKLMVYRMACMISERDVVYRTKRTGSSTEP